MFWFSIEFSDYGATIVYLKCAAPYREFIGVFWSFIIVYFFVLFFTIRIEKLNFWWEFFY